MPKTYPLIGIPVHGQATGAPAPVLSFVLRQQYAQAVADAGGAPLLVPPLADEATLAAIWSRLDGLLLPGGGDLAPALYGQQPRTKLIDVDDDLDRLELTLARWSLCDDRPLLAICRGMQVLNVAAGGTLIQDIPVDRPGSLAHRGQHGAPLDGIAHKVAVREGTLLASLVGREPLGVNSRHHQAVDRVAGGFLVSATASDGIVEAIELPGRRFTLGVQFHPEDLYPAEPRLAVLFAGFVAACR